MNTVPRPPSKQGIALIIVIGLLTVLAILALSFAVTMRTERLAARGFADSFRSREVAQSGLAQAMLAVQTDGANWFYPNWGAECVVSPGNAGGTTNLLFGAASNYIPRSLLATVATPATAANWTALRDSNNRLIGRYAYVAVNCSGLIDANFNYGRAIVTNTDRVYGQAPSELYLDSALLPEINNAGAVGLKRERTFTSSGSPRRKAWMRADTLMDLGILGRWGWTGTTPLNTTNPINLFHFSYFPLGWRDSSANPPVVVQPVNINLTANEMSVSTNFANIVNAFIGAGANPVDGQFMARSLIDMLDYDDIPGGTQTGSGLVNNGDAPMNCLNFCVEPVPMINEVMLRSIMVNKDGTWTLTIKVAVELWYPFRGANNIYPFALRVSAALEAPANTWTPLTQTVPAGDSIPVPAPGVTASYMGPYEFTFTSTSITNILPNALRIQQISLRRGNAQGTCHDYVSETQLKPWTQYLADWASGEKRHCWGAKDPRHNWKPLNTATQWDDQMDVDTLGKVNQCVTNTRGEYGELGADIWMYAGQVAYTVPLPPPMRVTSIGDLTFIPAGQDLAMRTLRPYDRVDAPIPGNPKLLDYFTIYTNNVRSLINANTQNEDVLATAFRAAPYENYPGEEKFLKQVFDLNYSATTVDANTATGIAQAIKGQQGATGFPNLSDISLAHAAVDGAAAAQMVRGQLYANPYTLMVPDAYQRESVLRNSSNLLGVRQNIFTFVVLGQAIKDSYPSGTADGAVQPEEVLGEAKLLVVAWRDPYLVNGRNRWFIRTLQWMDE